MEGIRLNGTFGSYRQSTASLEINDDGRDVSEAWRPRIRQLCTAFPPDFQVISWLLISITGQRCP